MPRKPRMRMFAAAVAGVVVLGLGVVTLPAAFAEETGGIAGHLTDGGTPVPSASVFVYDTTFGFVGIDSTDSAGAFQVDGLPSGGYKIQFQANGFSQCSSQKTSFNQADVITVVGGQTATVEETVRPYGILSGHVFNTDGTPAGGVSVFASGDQSGGSGITDPTGLYTIRYLEAGAYRVSFSQGFGSPTQWANNATEFFAAALIPVSVGATTTLDQTFVPLATVTGRIIDAGAGVSGVQVTFRPVGSFTQFSASTDASGFYQISAWPGTYTATLDRGGLVQYLPSATVPARAQQYELAAGPNVVDGQLLPTGTIKGRLVDPTPASR